MPKNKKRKLPKTGSKFTRKYNNKIYTITIIEENRAVKYEVGNKVYLSPSAAAKSITKYEVNGWRFWKIG